MAITMSALIFVTVLCTVCALFTAFFCWRAIDAMTRAELSATKLRDARAELSALSTSIAALDAKHRSLAGKVHSDPYWKSVAGPSGAVDGGAPLSPTVPLCENWALAQQQGPSSAAAKCECGYCRAMRDDRAARRARVGVKR